MSHILISKENIKNTGENMNLHCLFCNKKTPHKVGYMGSLCLDCDLELPDFDSCIAVYHHIKKKYGLERKHIANILNFSSSTISTYQNNRVGFLVDQLLELHYQNKLVIRHE